MCQEQIRPCWPGSLDDDNWEHAFKDKNLSTLVQIGNVKMLDRMNEKGTHFWLKWRMNKINRVESQGTVHLVQIPHRVHWTLALEQTCTFHYWGMLLMRWVPWVNQWPSRHFSRLETTTWTEIYPVGRGHWTRHGYLHVKFSNEVLSQPT